MFQQSYSQWQIVFWILVATYMTGGLMFLIFGSGELQPWNSPKTANLPVTDLELNSKHKEAVPLRRDST